MIKLSAIGRVISGVPSFSKVRPTRRIAMASDGISFASLPATEISSTTAMAPISAKLACLFPVRPTKGESEVNGVHTEEGTILDLPVLFEERCTPPSPDVDGIKVSMRQKSVETQMLVKRFLHDSADRERAKKKKGEAKKIPNYFVAVPVKNPVIREAGLTVQESIIKADEAWRSAMVSVRKFHITLMVLRLENDEDVERAHQALQVSKEKILGLPTSEPRFPDLQLDFKGLESFGNQVLYINPVSSDGLTKLHEMAKIVRETFADHGVGSTDKKASFEPHLTLMKLSKAPQLRRKGLKKIPPDVYAQHLSLDFGREVISTLQLCSMMLPQDKETGYYFVSKEVDLNAVEGPVSEHSDVTNIEDVSR